MNLVFALASALAYGVADFSGGLAARRAALFPVLVLSQAAGGLAVAAWAFGSGTPLPPLADLAWGLAGGVAGAFGLLLLYRGLARTTVAVVAPSSALFAALAPALAGFAFGETLSASALAGAALCVPAILLMAGERLGAASAEKTRSALAHGVGAGILIGFQLLAVSMAGEDSGVWPLVAARASAVAVLLVPVAATRSGLGAPLRALPLVLGAGLADSGGTVLFLLATRSGPLALASVVSSLFPAPTVLLAALVLKERIPATRWAGLVLALAGVALIGLA